MLSVISTKYIGTDGKMRIEAVCLHDDTKPTTGILNGSKILEMDTGKVYLYDEENTTWREWA